MNRSLPQQNWVRGCVCGLLVVLGAVVMRPWGDPHQLGSVPPFLLGAAIMLAGFYGGLRLTSVPLMVIAGVAVVVRLILLGQLPGGDIYRYVWEGKLLLQQINPYVHAPDSAIVIPLRDALWEVVEHKTFSAIYPPLAQWVFAVLAALSPSALFFKVAFCAADLLTGALLWRRFGGQATLLYLWNPLVIYSFAGGGHYDSVFVLLLVLGWLAWERNRFDTAILWVGAAVAVKWMALPILCWAGWQVVRQRGWVAGLRSGVIGLAPFAVSWLAVSVWTGAWTGQLHPQKFTEFARSAELIPRLVGWVWDESRFNNSWFLPPLAVAWALVIFRAKSFLGAAEWALFLAMVFSPLIHAWYFAWIIPFAVASRNLGSIFLTASGFVYFVVYHRMHAQPELGWIFLPWEIALLWGPFVAGFLWTYRRCWWPQKAEEPA